MIKVFEINFINKTRTLKDEYENEIIALCRSRRFASLKCKELNEESENRYHIIKEENGYIIISYDDSKKIYKYEVGEC